MGYNQGVQSNSSVAENALFTAADKISARMRAREGAQQIKSLVPLPVIHSTINLKR